jgi:hypothetical protein
MSEAALRWSLGADVMLAQLAYLSAVSQRPNVQLGIVPLGPTRATVPPRSLHLYDRRMAVAATDLGAVFINTPPEINRYIAAFERVEGWAVFDDDMRRLLDRIADDYRRP